MNNGDKSLCIRCINNLCVMNNESGYNILYANMPRIITCEDFKKGITDDYEVQRSIEYLERHYSFDVIKEAFKKTKNEKLICYYCNEEIESYLFNNVFYDEFICSKCVKKNREELKNYRFKEGIENE